jgi:ATP-dependent RNA helicase DHX36
VGPFLSQAMDPPEPSAVTNATHRLQAIGALDANETLTPLGGHLANLPVDPGIGRLLIMGAVFDCLDAVLTIAASLSYRNPFVMPMERRAAADEARRRFAEPYASDHWALLRAFQEFEVMRRGRRWGEIRDWCQANFLVKDTLELIGNMRLQLAEVGPLSSVVSLASFLPSRSCY